MPEATQTKHPWRATARTVAAAGVALLTLLPTIAAVGHLNTVTWVSQLLVVAATVTRVLAIPGVDAWLKQYLPFLSATPRDPETDQ